MNLFQNTRLLEYLPKVIWPALLATLKMLLVSVALGVLIGGIVAIILVVSRPTGLKPNPWVYKSLNLFINAIRSFPALILIVALTPLTRFIVGTSIGWVAASVSLTIIAIPLVARLIESTLLEVNPSVITAAESFGASRTQIIFGVMFCEALPSIITNLTYVCIQALANTTLAGAVGAGGLGAIALTFGYERFDDVMMYAIVIVFAVWVWIIQGIGHWLYKKTKQ